VDTTQAVVTLSEEDAKRLKTTFDRLEESQGTLEATINRLKADVIDARLAQIKALNELGQHYGFDPSGNYKFDSHKRTLTEHPK
jgi:hypothetical protein